MTIPKLQHLLCITVWSAVLVLSMQSAGMAQVYKVYYLGGQSNMEGFGYVDELPDSLKGPVPGVMIFHGTTAPDNAEGGGLGQWTELRPGHGTGFSFDGSKNQYSDRLGLELTFARHMKALDPEAHIALIKYERGGTSIDTAAARHFGAWDPDYRGADDLNQYDHFLATLRNALSVEDINGDGEPDTLEPAGILWMQGESDGAHDEATAARYEAHLKRLMDLMRAALRVDDLPVVIGRISDSGQDDDGKVWDYGDAIRAAQAAFVEHDARAALVTSTDDYGYSDPWHYDTVGYLDLGRRFAEAMMALQEPSAAQHDGR